MPSLQRFVRTVRRVQYLLGRRRREDEIDEEIAFHRAMTERALETRGVDRREAELATRRALGPVLAARDEARDVWIWPWLQNLSQDLRFAIRLLAKDRSFTAVAVLALALGIGVNSTQFTIVNAICLRGLPIDRPDRVLHIGTRDARDRDGGVSYRDFEDLRPAAARADGGGSAAFIGIAAFSSAPIAIVDAGRAPDRATVAYISANTFRLIGEAPRIGRDFRDEDDRPGAAPVVILGSGLWRRRYGGDPGILGRTIEVGGAPATVIGVMPDRFRLASPPTLGGLLVPRDAAAAGGTLRFPANADLWQPLALMPGIGAQRRDARTLGAFGRLTDAATLGRARAALEGVSSRLSREHADTNAGIRAFIEPINNRYNGDITNPAWIVFMIVGGLLVLVACGNVAGLLLMRSARRAREIAIRASLGATRGRVVRQLLVESLALAMLGGALGLALSIVGARLFKAAIPEDALPYWIAFTLDGRVVAALAAVCLGTAMVFGLAPALHLAKHDVNHVLKETDRAGAGGGVRARRWTAAFLTVEFALTMVLLAAMTRAIGDYRRLEGAALAIETSPLLTMWVTLANTRYERPEARLAFYARLEERLDAASTVSAAALTTTLPFSGGPTRQLTIDGPSTIAGEPPPAIRTIAVGSRYFDTIALPLYRGRAFTDTDTDGTPGHETAIVNRRFASLYFGTTDPIGRRIRLAANRTSSTSAATAERASSDAWLTIVGIAPDVPQRAIAEQDALAYIPYRLDPPATMALMVRASAEPDAITSSLREEVRALDPDLPVYRARTMAQVVAESRWNPRIGRGLLSVIGAIALGLSAIGLYAVTAHALALRTREIGVRIALGARAPQVLWIVLRRALLQLAAGLAAGLVFLYTWDRIFGAAPQSMLDPAIVIPVSTMMAVMTVIACLSPARRATRVDPVTALRHD